MSQTITVQEGDPVFSVWIWRRDSMLLARLREPLAELQVLAMLPCEHPRYDEMNCGTCWPDQMRRLWSKVEAATRAPT